MKRKLFLAFAFIIGSIHMSNAQLQEGNVMLGADLGSGITTSSTNGLFGFNLGLDEDSGYNIGVSPKIGYFFSDNFVAGTIVNLGYNNAAGDDEDVANTFIYGVQAFSRFYIAPSDVDLGESVPVGQFFIETQAGIAGRNIEGGDSTNGFSFGFGPGYSYFLNPNVALEASVKYNGLVGGGSDNYQNSLGVNLGIQIFLEKSEAKDAMDDFQ
jgi:opacity protein-like surface antigen